MHSNIKLWGDVVVNIRRIKRYLLRLDYDTAMKTIYKYWLSGTISGTQYHVLKHFIRIHVPDDGSKLNECEIKLIMDGRN